MNIINIVVLEISLFENYRKPHSLPHPPVPVENVLNVRMFEAILTNSKAACCAIDWCIVPAWGLCY